MFAGINVDVGKDGSKVSQKVQQCADGSTVGQLSDAQDNLVRVWSVFWPWEFGPCNLRGVISKYKGFSDIPDVNKNNILESFANRMSRIVIHLKSQF